jgi:hypothetical protein
MRRLAFFGLVISLLLPLLASAPAHAQATRTWVSGVGDDANPCSRTAPCKTFAGAISKTAPAGEIDCLDPGGFGAVTITKSITIDCSETVGSALVSGTNGIVISAAATDRVVLRNIRIMGLNTGLAGIRILAAAVVSIENCVVTQFAQQGILDLRTGGGSRLYIKDTTVSLNAGSGIALGAQGTSNTEIDNTTSINNQFGVSVATGNNAMIRRSVFSGNSTAGVEADGGAQLNVNDSTISGNATGVQVGGTIRLANSDIAFNTTGISGTAISFGNNRISGNNSPGTAPSPAGGAAAALGQQ